MLKIASLHFGSGSGHILGGFTLWQSFVLGFRGDFKFYLITDSALDVPVEDDRLEVLTVFLEPEKITGNNRDTMLYQFLVHLDADIIIVDTIWFPVRPILNDFRAKKVFFSCFMPLQWFLSPPVDNGMPIEFDPEQYDLVFAIDPHFSFTGSENIPPVINIHEDLLKPPYIIRSVLDVPDNKRMALVAHNGHEGEIDEILKKADIDPDEYCLRSISSFDEKSKQLFPLSHYLSGVDLAIGGCGYHFFYETMFYNIPSLYIPQPRIGNEQHWRYEHCLDYNGPYDGADQMVQRIMELF